jgi:hypothetical protein
VNLLYFRNWSSSCKSVHNRSNISSCTTTQVKTRTHTQLQPGIRGGACRLGHRWPHHTLYASKRIEAYGITLFLGLNDPRTSCVRAPHTPAVYSIGIHRAAYSTADGRLIRQYTPASTQNESHSSPFLKPTEAP